MWTALPWTVEACSFRTKTITFEATLTLPSFLLLILPGQLSTLIEPFFTTDQLHLGLLEFRSDEAFGKLRPYSSRYRRSIQRA